MINLVVALSSEARPLIGLFGMRRRSDARGFRVYAGEAARLIITGIGKPNAAAGTAYLAGLEGGENRPWLNVGIAGHAELATGTGAHALKITDQTTGRNWYPPRVKPLPGEAVCIASFDQAVTRYPQSVACDMEASAYYSVATKFSPGELVQCYKIISDNPQCDVGGLTPAVVKNLVGDQLESIREFAESLTEVSRQLPTRQPWAGEIGAFCDRWYFTVSQRVQLEESLRKMLVRGAKQCVRVEFWQRCGSAREVLSEMDRELRALPVRL